MRTVRRKHRTSILATAAAGTALGISLLGLTWSREFEIVRVRSHSMDSTLADGERLLIRRYAAYSFVLRSEPSPPPRGRVVALRSPEVGSEFLVKRVVAVGGDTVAIRKGAVYLNGKEVREPYVHWDPGYTRSDENWPIGPRSEAGVRVPPGCVFVLGDNRGVSLDSRQFGAVPLRDIVGVLVWPHAPAS